VVQSCSALLVQFLSALDTWCWQVEEGVRNGAYCRDIMGLFNRYLSRHISDTVGDLLGDDAGSIVDVAKTTLTGSREDLVSLVNATEGEDQKPSITAETADGLVREPDEVPPE
jgi:hypothetical protein